MCCGRGHCVVVRVGHVVLSNWTVPTPDSDATADRDVTPDCDAMADSDATADSEVTRVAGAWLLWR